MLTFISVSSLEKWKNIIQPSFHAFLLFVLIPMNSSHLVFCHLFLKAQPQKEYSTLSAASHLTLYMLLQQMTQISAQEQYILYWTNQMAFLKN